MEAVWGRGVDVEVLDLALRAYFQIPFQWNHRGASLPFSFIGAVLALYAAACVVSFGFERLMFVSVSCLISVRGDCVVVFALWFRDEIRDAVG
ncbi:hypothetical protein QL285_050034 [Trifolium repens]|nr:hypothetical protein QL285_050034 [Trifolium repens]